MFTQIKARKHANAISTETAHLLNRDNSPDVDIALSDIAYLWGWFEAVDICLFNINEKMDVNLTKCFFILANQISPINARELMQGRLETSMDLVNKAKGSIGSPSIMPLLARFGANYLSDNGYGLEEELFDELLESIKRIKKSI